MLVLSAFIATVVKALDDLERSSFLSMQQQQDMYSTNVCVSPNEMKVCVFATSYEVGDRLP
jgi:hypothetical protein